MKIKIRKITKKSWFYFLSVGGIATLFFTRIFFGGTNIISLSQLESCAKKVMIQTGIVNVASADIPHSGDASSDGSDGSGGGGGASGGDCDGHDGGDSCGDSGSY